MGALMHMAPAITEVIHPDCLGLTPLSILLIHPYGHVDEQGKVPLAHNLTPHI